MAYKISNMLQRGMHFRRVAYSNIRRIMAAGAQGVEITISGKIKVMPEEETLSYCRKKLSELESVKNSTEYKLLKKAKLIKNKRKE